MITIMMTTTMMMILMIVMMMMMMMMMIHLGFVFRNTGQEFESRMLNKV